MNIPMQAQALKKIFDTTFEEIRKKYDLTMNEIVVLVYLINTENKKNTAKDIVDEIMTAKSHISKSVKLLEDKNIITRTYDYNDKKVIHLKIVNKDSEVIKEISQENSKINKRIVDGISSEELVILEKSLEKIKENIKNIIFMSNT